MAPNVSSRPCPLDPYITLAPLQDPPPDHGPLPTANLLVIHVPSDNAEIQMGAIGGPNGISAYADTSVSLSAKTAGSSLGVGTNGQVNGGDDGISLKTDGKLTEVVDNGRKLVVTAGGSTEEITGPRNTTNTGNWTLHTTETRTDTIDGNYKISVPKSNLTMECPAGKLSVKCFEKSEHVLGKEVRFLADHGVKNRIGNENNTFIGTQMNTNISMQTNLNASIITNVFYSKIEYCLLEMKEVTVNKQQALVNLTNNINEVKTVINKIAKAQLALEDKAMVIAKSTIRIAKATLHSLL
jgi:hypothetical protein